MRIGIGIGDIAGAPAGVDDLVAQARRAEADGFASGWFANIFGMDAIMAAAVCGRETSRMELGTAVVPTYPRHPVAMAQQALSAQAVARGRFTLGIGLSHQVVIEGMLGLSFAKPCPILVAALAPKMLALTGREADGTITWMTGPRTLREHTVPRISEAAAAAGRPKPRVVVGLPVAVTRETAGARTSAARVFQIYGFLPSYRAMLDREGYAGPEDAAIIGDEKTVSDRLDELAAAGVDEFAAVTFDPSADGRERTRALLRTRDK